MNPSAFRLPTFAFAAALLLLAGCAAAQPAGRNQTFGCTERTGPLPGDAMDRRGELCERLKRGE
jgi:hypothetical protein